MKASQSFEVESFLHDEEVQHRSKKVNFEVLPLTWQEEDGCREGLHDFLQVERLERVEPLESEQSYERVIERAFDPVTDEKNTQKYIDHEHEFATGYKNHAQEEHRRYKREEKARKKDFSMWSHIRKIIQDVLSPYRAVLQEYLRVAKSHDEISTYRYHSIRTPGNQPGTFDDKKFKDDKEREMHIHHDHVKQIQRERARATKGLERSI